MTKVCKECGAVVQGRSDKQFCSGYCRSTFNNRKNEGRRETVKKVNKILIQNRRILAELNPTGKTKVHRKKLEQAGFKFDYLTNTYTTKSGKVYRFCYDHGYLALEENYFALVVKEEYVT